eukprot:NODE_3653_length_866_cov_1447.832206_g3631_i0.p1 GENE.NODE_3653_length_866_cov_1447.832206_g3631_i0~~NODE_3653_length_866_cov_1447.832206_g3631_i0.p1  ORF type:complete len:240 (+),score=61.24 NODE_3653_length_866_cov_1447.832206_g3631_i0:66-785(+)
MKFVIAEPTTGATKTHTIDDEKTLLLLHDKRMSQIFEGDLIGFPGYEFKITGGCDRDGFPMKQGVMANSRVRLLLERGTVGFQAWRKRVGARKRRSVRGCIVGGDIAVLNLTVQKQGPEPIEGLTDVSHPRRLGPKRASKIRQLFGLTNEDDVRKFVIKRTVPGKDGKRDHAKAPKIQRLVTPVTLQRRRRKLAVQSAVRRRSAMEREAYQRTIDAQSLAANQRRKARSKFLKKKKADA